MDVVMTLLGAGSTDTETCSDCKAAELGSNSSFLPSSAVHIVLHCTALHRTRLASHSAGRLSPLENLTPPVLVTAHVLTQHQRVALQRRTQSTAPPPPPRWRWSWSWT